MPEVAEHTKQSLLKDGKKLIEKFCLANNLKMPEIRVDPYKEWPYNTCAYYRYNYIAICPRKCATPATTTHFAYWSWPSYVVDRTPYGVLAHEMGHAVDLMSGTSDQRRGYFSEFGAYMRKKSKEPKLTSYCPNDAEWFAEHCRLFITNPDLLKALRPKLYKLMLQADLKPVIEDPWEVVLADAPDRIQQMARKKVMEAKTRRKRRWNGDHKNGN